VSASNDGLAGGLLANLEESVTLTAIRSQEALRIWAIVLSKRDSALETVRPFFFENV
jgi:hypothetical protein